MADTGKTGLRRERHGEESAGQAAKKRPSIHPADPPSGRVIGRRDGSARGVNLYQQAWSELHLLANGNIRAG